MESAQTPPTGGGEDETAKREVPEPVVLIIADISGYTRYMTANARSLAHSQTIITELVRVIVKQVELPLEVAKLEGDAVFLYGRRPADASARVANGRLIGQKLLTFFHIFREKVSELSQSTTCTCHACKHIEKLRLKLIVHSGEALFHRILNFEELAGVDVIIVHRLLKNSVPSNQYLLLTEAAHREVEFGVAIPLVAGSETYEDLGRIKTLVFLPEGEHGPEPGPSPVTSRPGFLESWNLFRKLWFGPLLQAHGGPSDAFSHVESKVGKPARNGFAVLTLVLTPLFLPAGLVVCFLHTRRQRHMHAADGSCCAAKPQPPLR